MNVIFTYPPQVQAVITESSRLIGIYSNGLLNDVKRLYPNESVLTQHKIFASDATRCKLVRAHAELVLTQVPTKITTLEECLT